MDAETARVVRDIHTDRQRHTHTHKTITVTLVHARRGLSSVCYGPVYTRDRKNV